MRIEERLREAELAVLNAPFLADGWLDAVRRIGQVTGTRKVQLIGFGGSRFTPLNVISDLPSDPNGHIGNMALHGACNWRVGSTGRVGTVQFEDHYAAYRAVHDTSDYDDACSDLDGPFGCQAPLLLDAHCLVGLALIRSASEGPSDQLVLECLSRVARQAVRAVRVQLALGQEAAELMLEGPSNRTEATLLLNAFGQIAAMTEAAEALFDHPQGLRLDGLRPCLAHEAEQRALEKVFARLLASDGISGPVLHETKIGRCPDRPHGRWRLHVVRLPAPNLGMGLGPQLALTLSPLGAAA